MTVHKYNSTEFPNSSVPSCSPLILDLWHMTPGTPRPHLPVKIKHLLSVQEGQFVLHLLGCWLSEATRLMLNASLGIKALRSAFTATNSSQPALIFMATAGMLTTETLFLNLWGDSFSIVDRQNRTELHRSHLHATSCQNSWLPVGFWAVME